MRTAKPYLVSVLITGSLKLRKIYKHFHREGQEKI
jgi:hypothetical protein